VLRKFGSKVLTEVEKWLALHGLSMQVSEAEQEHELYDIEQALAVLRAYGLKFDVTRSEMPLWQHPGSGGNARRGDTCHVRIEHKLAASGEINK
jgi:hypothetical protein